jgi:hypothetical protein
VQSLKFHTDLVGGQMSGPLDLEAPYQWDNEGRMTNVGGSGGLYYDFDAMGRPNSLYALNCYSGYDENGNCIGDPVRVTEAAATWGIFGGKRVSLNCAIFSPGSADV